MDFLFLYALYGTLVHDWRRYGDETEFCDLPADITHRFAELANEPTPLLPDYIDAVFEMLQEDSEVPKPVALACLRHNLTQEVFTDAARVHVRGLLASLELQGSARGRH